MSELDRYLSSTQLLDCTGQVDTTLTLLIDGRVRVERYGHRFVVDPASGLTEPPGAHVPEDVRLAARELAGGRR
jgi:hypothetical protein